MRMLTYYGLCNLEMTFGIDDAILTNNIHLLKDRNTTNLIQTFSEKGFQQTK